MIRLALVAALATSLAAPALARTHGDTTLGDIVVTRIHSGQPHGAVTQTAPRRHRH